MNLIYNFNNENNVYFIFFDLFLNFLLLNLSYQFFIIFCTIIIFLDLILKKMYNRKSPVSINTFTLSISIINWFIFTIIKEVINEFRKPSVCIGWSVVLLQYLHYSDSIKKYKSLPNNIIFIIGSLFISIINNYKSLIFEKKHNSLIFKKIENNQLINEYLYKCQFGDIVKLENNYPLPLNFEVFSDKESYINIDLSYVTGEKKIVKKKTKIISEISKYKNTIYSSLECLNDINLLPSGCIIKNGKNIFGRIINVESYNFEYKKPYITNFIENIKNKFIFLSFMLGISYIYIGYLVNISNIDYTTTFIQILISSQMIIPLSYNTILNIIFIIVYKFKILKGFKNLPLQSYENIISLNNSYLITDKTGTLTENSIKIIKFFYYNNKKDDIFVPLLCDQVDDEVEEITMKNYLINTNKISYVHNICFENKVRKIYKIINNKKFITIFLGLFRNISGTLTLVIEDHKYYILYQGSPNKYLLEIMKINCDEWEDSFKLRNKNNIFTNNPNRDWYHIKSNIYEINDNYFFNIINILEEFNHTLLLKYIIENNFFLKHQIISICFMDNPIKQGVTKALKKYNNGYNSIICTGDNPENTKKLCHFIDIKYELCIYITTPNEFEYFKITYYHQLKSIKMKNILLIFKGANYINILKEIIDTENYFLFSSCTPIDKKKIVEFVQSINKHVTFTGDGVNDIMALKSADLGISFPQDDNNNYLSLVKESSNTTVSELSDSYWCDLGNNIFDNDIYFLQQIVFILFNMILLKCSKSSIQLGYILAKKKIDDPIPSSLLDLIFDIILTVHWIFIPLIITLLNIKLNLSNKIFNYSVHIALLSYSFGTIISYYFFTYYVEYIAIKYTLMLIGCIKLSIFYLFFIIKYYN